MADIPRLNGAIKALESGKPAFVPFTSGEISNALTITRRAVRRRGVRDGAQPVRHQGAARLPAIHAEPPADRRLGQHRAGGDAVRAHPAERRREQPVDRQAGAGYRRLWHRMAARIHGRGCAQRGAGLPLSAPARGEVLRPAGPARRRAAHRRALLGADRRRNTTRAPTPGR